MSDLFGSDQPVPDGQTDSDSAEAADDQGGGGGGGSGARFAWCDGVFLSALKAGKWVLLDELNLATQVSRSCVFFWREVGQSGLCVSSVCNYCVPVKSLMVAVFPNTCDESVGRYATLSCRCKSDVRCASRLVLCIVAIAPLLSLSDNVPTAPRATILIVILFCRAFLRASTPAWTTARRCTSQSLVVLSAAPRRSRSSRRRIHWVRAGGERGFPGLSSAVLPRWVLHCKDLLSCRVFLFLRVYHIV